MNLISIYRNYNFYQKKTQLFFIYFYIYIYMIYRPVKSAYQTFYNYKSFQGHIDSILCFISLSINFFMISFKVPLSNWSYYKSIPTIIWTAQVALEQEKCLSMESYNSIYWLPGRKVTTHLCLTIYCPMPIFFQPTLQILTFWFLKQWGFFLIHNVDQS